MKIDRYWSREELAQMEILPVDDEKLIAEYAEAITGEITVNERIPCEHSTRPMSQCPEAE